MTKKEYFELIAWWREKYHVEEYRTSPFLVKLSCVKCGKIKKRMHRHHKSNDLFFARLLPDSYAARYVVFHPDDVVKLCAKCHSEVHLQVYDGLVRDMKLDMKESKYKLSEEWCEKWRAIYLQRFEEWLDDSSTKKQSGNNSNQRSAEGWSHYHSRHGKRKD